MTIAIEPMTSLEQGDSFERCLAALLGIKREDVPDFPWPGAAPDSHPHLLAPMLRWHARVSKWLEAVGLRMTAFSSSDRVLQIPAPQIVVGRIQHIGVSHSHAFLKAEGKTFDPSPHGPVLHFSEEHRFCFVALRVEMSPAFGPNLQDLKTLEAANVQLFEANKKLRAETYRLRNEIERLKDDLEYSSRGRP